MTKYVLSEEELLSLLKYEAKLIALENGGVDNWEWYGESIHESEDWDEEISDWNVSKYLDKYTKIQ